jgi:superfamily I DNA/RNA helicase
MVSHFSILGQEDGIKNIDKVIEIFREITFKLLDKGENLALNNRIIDYTDMIYLPVKWNLNAHVSFDFVFVDECQDLSLSQIYIISKCMHQSGRVIAVGDPFQSIYGFAGADTQSFDNLKKLLKAENFVLKGSFRCAQNVIKEAKKVRPEITGHRKEEGEVKSIDYDEILSFIQANDLVVSRQRETIISLALQLMEAGQKIQIHERLVPAITSSLRRYFKQKELEINLLTYNDLDEFFRQVRERAYNEIDREARRILNEDEKKIIVGRKKSMAKELLGYMKRHWKDYPNVRTISSYCAYFESSLLSINATDAIRLYTIHFAKGLEEDRVFVLDYDTLPVIKNSMRAWEKKQEINLKYVAITRPKDVLFLVKSKNFEAKEQPRLLFEEI